MSTKIQQKRRGPVVIEADLPEGDSPQDAAPVPELTGAEGRAMQQVTRLAARKFSWLTKLFWAGVTALLGMMISVAAWDFVTNLLARNVYLGQAALGLFALVTLILAIVIVRELATISRLAKIDHIRSDVRDALADGGEKPAENVVKRLDALYSSREELRWPRQTMAEQRLSLIHISEPTRH